MVKAYSMCGVDYRWRHILILVTMTMVVIVFSGLACLNSLDVALREPVVNCVNMKIASEDAMHIY